MRTLDRRYAKLALNLILLGSALLIVMLAVQELKTRGTTSASGLSIADYQARAKVEARPAPAFRAPTLSGSTVRLSDFRGEIVVMNFWASWCGPCRREAPGLKSTSDAYANEGVQFLGVDYRDDPAAARAFEEEFGITYPSAVDPSGEIAGRYELAGLPTTFVIDAKGQIVYRFLGYTTAPLLRRAIDDVLSPTAP